MYNFIEINIIQQFAFEIVFSLGLLFAIVFFTIFKDKRWNFKIAFNFAVFLLLALILANSFVPTEKTLIYNNFYMFDNLSKYGRYFVCFLSIMCLYGSRHYIIKSNYTFEYILILLFAILGLTLLLSAYDFLSIYLAVELQSLAFYVLAASRKDSTYSVEAGLKYFILGSFASALLVFGMSFIYCLTGIIHLSDLTLFLSNISLEQENSYLFMFGICLILSGLLFKLGAAPFHMWVPEVYDGAPSSVSMFFAVVPKVVIFTLIYRICGVVFADMADYWFFIIFISTALSLALGSLGGLTQRRVKRLLAFSSINHVGYILMGVLASTTYGLFGLIIYVAIYSLSSLVIWTILISTQVVKPNKEEEQMVRYIVDFKGLVSANPTLAFILALTLFSMAGTPPMAGFFAKAYIFLAVIHSKLYLIAFISIFFSLISAFYYLRFIKQIFTFNYDWHSQISMKPIPKEASLVISFTFLLLVSFVLYSDFITIPAYSIISF